MRTLWDSISHAWYVVSLVATVAVTHIRHNMTKLRTVDATATHNAKREKTLYTTTPTVSKLNGYGIQQSPVTYAAYPSSLVTLSRRIMLMQETQTVNLNQHTANVTPVGVVPHSHTLHSYKTYTQTQVTV